MLIAVCICTFRRPDRLAETLRGIARLRFKRCPPPALHLIVVDNDGNDATRAVVDAFAAPDIPIDYAVEKRRGISSARNACLDRVPATASFIAFLDDDVVPRESWLEELLQALHCTEAEAATGPYVPVYDPGTAQWIRTGRFFASPRAKSPQNLASVDFGVMGNFLIRSSLVRSAGLRFDVRLGLIGGEDRKFFNDVFAAGGRVVWAGDAIVDHHIAPERLSFAYIVRREFGVGCAAAILKRGAPLSGIRLVGYGAYVTAKLLLKLVLLAPNALLAAIRHNAFRRVKPVLEIANLSGRLYGLCGMKYEVYR